MATEVIVRPREGLSVELNGINVISSGERKGSPRDLFWPWCAANIAVLGISYGSFFLGFGVSFWQATIAGLLGTVLSFLLVGLVALAILTVGYVLLTVGHINFSAVTSVPGGSPQAVLGTLIFAATGFGLGWVNSGADYSRYLPRNASSSAVVAWTTFGAAIAPVLLVVYGLLLAASDSKLNSAIASDPVGALTTLLPTWYLLLFALVAIGGLIGGAILDIYSSGLALLTLGLRIPRWTAAGLDGVIMIFGTIYVVWIASNFFFPFEGFLITLGVPIAAWCGVFLADLLLRKRDYAETELYDSRGRYGLINWVAVGTTVVATFLGWGLVTNGFADWLHWQGYLLEPFGLGPKDNGPWTYANLGVFVALGLGFLGQFVLGRSQIAKQEAAADPVHALTKGSGS